MMHYSSNILQGEDVDPYSDLGYGDLGVTNHGNLLGSLDHRYICQQGIIGNTQRENSLLQLSGITGGLSHAGDMGVFQDSLDLQNILPMMVNDQSNELLGQNLGLYGQTFPYQPTSLSNGHMINMQHQLALMQHERDMQMAQHIMQPLPLPQSSDNSVNPSDEGNNAKTQKTKRRGKQVTSEMRQILLQKNREAQRRYRQSLSEEKRLLTLEKNRAAHKRYRENLSPEAQALCREKNRLAQRKRRENLSLESKLLSQEKNRQAQKRRRGMTDQQKTTVSDTSTRKDLNPKVPVNLNNNYDNLPPYGQPIDVIQGVGMPSSHDMSVFGLNNVNLLPMTATSIPGNIQINADAMQRLIGLNNGPNQFNYLYKV